MRGVLILLHPFAKIYVLGVVAVVGLDHGASVLSLVLQVAEPLDGALPGGVGVRDLAFDLHIVLSGADHIDLELVVDFVGVVFT